MKAAGARLWAYVRSYFSVLLVSLGLVAVVGALEAVTPFLIGLIFDTLLGPSAAPVLTIPVINARFSVTGFDGGTVLVLLVAITVVKAIAEYSSVNMLSYLGQAVVRAIFCNRFDNRI